MTPDELNVIYDDFKIPLDEIPAEIRPRITVKDGAADLNNIPFRLICQHALTQALKQITHDNEFNTEIGNNVFRGRLFYGETDPLPMLSILENSLPPEELVAPIETDKTNTLYQLLVQGWVQDDKGCPTDPAYFLLADIKERLAALKEDKYCEKKIFRFGYKTNAVEDISWDGGVVVPPEKASSWISFYLRIQLTLIEDNQHASGVGSS